jgi:signal transduction histidine kinase
VLILLPVLVLAVAGAWALRQDKLVARHEALESAQRLAQETARLLNERLSQPGAWPGIAEQTFRVDAHRNLIFPPDLPLLPLPAPLELARLNQVQLQAWAALAESANAPQNESARRVEALNRFLELNPPEEFAAQARLGKAQLLAATGQATEASLEFRALLQQFPEARVESGLPLTQLAEWEMLKLAVNSKTESAAVAAEMLTKFCSNLVHHPTYLTTPFLQHAEALESSLGPSNASNAAGVWQRHWEHHEALRGLAREALAQLALQEMPLADSPTHSVTSSPPSVPAFFWFHADDTALALPTGTVQNVREPKTGLAAAATRSVLSPPIPAPAADGSDNVSTPLATRQPRAWLATRGNESDVPGTIRIICRALGSLAWANDGLQTRPVPVISPAAKQVFRRLVPQQPPWLSCTYEIQGVGLAGELPFPGELLASAAAGHGLRVNVFFSRPELFYRRQQTRSLLFGGLIALAALAGLVGFVAARRAFFRQQQLNALKSNFVASVSHELRAPIASVRLMAENLESGTVTDPARQDDYFRFIVQECRRLSALIENVLNFARIEQGRKQYEFEPTDLAVLVRQTSQILEPAAAQKQLVLLLKIPEASLAALPAPPSLDGPAMQQALVNLLDNAIKHSPPGQTILVGVEIHEEPATGATAATTAGPRSLRLFVEDHGPGIPPQEHQRIFERFYRRGSELRRQTQGVGIGLSIVKHIAEAHGGRVRVESEPGRGSRFTIEIPLALASA